MCTSMPKAGTHLLERLLCLHPCLYRALVPTLRLSTQDRYRPLKVLENLKKGQLIVSHLQYNENLKNSIETHQIKHFLIIRDPRDAIVSDFFFIQKLQQHHAHEELSKEPDIHHAIDRLIMGIHSDSQPLDIKIKRYQDWIAHAHLIYFEDLIGSGMIMQSQRDTVQKIFNFLNLPLREDGLKSIMARLISPDSPTYRKGGSGEWRQFFSPENKRLFKEVAGTKLIELGYEKDMNW